MWVQLFSSMKSFSSIQSKNNSSISFQFSPKPISDTPTTLAASHHAREISSLMRWRRWVESMGLARHLESRLCMCAPAHCRPILAPTELQTKQKNLTCVTGHKHNKLHKWMFHNLWVVTSLLRCFFTFKMAAERSLLTHGSVSHKTAAHIFHLQSIHFYNIHSFHKPKILTDNSLWQSISL